MEMQQIIKMLTRMDVKLKELTESTSADMKACQEKTEVRLEEEDPTSMEMKPEVVHEEVSLEDAARMPVEEPRKRSRD
jgi:hypothetical protein